MASARVVLVEDVLAGVCGLVVVKAHKVRLGGSHLYAELLPLGDRCLHCIRRSALLLGDTPDAVLKLVEVDGVLALCLVLGKDNVHIVLGELPVKELAILAELLEVLALKLLVQTRVALEYRLAAVPQSSVLAILTDRTRCCQACMPPFRGAILAALCAVDVVYKLVEIDCPITSLVALVKKPVRSSSVQALHKAKKFVEVQLVVTVFVHRPEARLELRPFVCHGAVGLAFEWGR
mmetsp:Transcript_113037/g.330347  ORF Transcript_113037/g.330347 Transcript_113037/m.330347 type:complete len:235 (-) Transcript_113037:31-735(-)